MKESHILSDLSFFCFHVLFLSASHPGSNQLQASTHYLKAAEEHFIPSSTLSACNGRDFFMLNSDRRRGAKILFDAYL